MTDASETSREPAYQKDMPIGPDLLAEAATVLPEVVDGSPVRCAEVLTALYEGACVLGLGRDRPHRLRLAKAALELFAAYLLAGTPDLPAEPSRKVVGRWLVSRDPVAVQLALSAAAGYWRRELASGSPAPTQPALARQSS